MRAAHRGGTQGDSHRRVTTATRVFALATALGLAAGTGRLSELSVPFLTLCALAALTSVPVKYSRFWILVPIAEAGVTAALLVKVDAPGSLLVSLAVPPLVAGVNRGMVAAASATAVEAVAMVAALLIAEDAVEVDRQVYQIAPWILVGLGMGVLGARTRQADTRNSADQAGYESAHKLLGQLRAVSRRLSSGLDTSTLANHIVTHAAEVLHCDHALVLVGPDASTLTPLARCGIAQAQFWQGDSTLRDCWAKKRVVRGTLEDDVKHRTVLPLRVGSRMVGVVLADTTTPPNRATVKELQRDFDEQGLRLESALLFDEIRATATTEERNRLAREIHDGVAQEIASLGYLVDELTATTTSSASEEVARDLRRELSRIVTDLRLSIFDLRTGVGPHGGLGAALSDYAREVGTRTGMTVHLALSEQPQRLPVGVEAELMRIAQEAMTNARKHSRATNLWVSLNTESSIASLRIEDDGIGSARKRDDHYGLQIMRERAQRIGAEVSIGDRCRGGTSVTVTVWPNNNTSTGVRHEHLSLAG